MSMPSMSCICQYIVNSSSEMNSARELESFLLPRSDEDEGGDNDGIPEAPMNNNREAVTDDVKISVCVSELVSCRSENWLLKKKLRDYEVTIENLEQLMTTIMSKQHKILGEMSQLRKRNRELQIECNLQREYHSMERNALVKELHDVKTLSRERLYDIAENDPEELQDTDDSLDEYIMRKNSDDSENEEEQVSSPMSTAASSVDSTPYTTEVSDDDDESQESEEEDDDQEDFSAITDSDTD